MTHVQVGLPVMDIGREGREERDQMWTLSRFLTEALENSFNHIWDDSWDRLRTIWHDTGSWAEVYLVRVVDEHIGGKM